MMGRASLAVTFDLETFLHISVSESRLNSSYGFHVIFKLPKIKIPLCKFLP